MHQGYVHNRLRKQTKINVTAGAGRLTGRTRHANPPAMVKNKKRRDSPLEADQQPRDVSTVKHSNTKGPTTNGRQPRPYPWRPAAQLHRIPVSGRRQNSSHYVQQTADRRHRPSTTNEGAPGGGGREKTGTERRLDSSRGDTSVGRGTIFTRSPWGRPAARATGTGAQTEGPASSGWWACQWLPPTATRPTPAAVRHPPQGARQPTSTPTNERMTRTTKAPTETPKGDERSQPRDERGRGMSECEGAPQTCAGWKETGEQSQAP